MEDLFNQINIIKQKMEDNRKERAELHLKELNLDKEYLDLGIILTNLLNQIKHDGEYKF